ncbi:hypothetical protein BDR26DRAFT_934178 [Obelidium mucronatum]|nr:hypothetical protein BDR26DRAFT_934178 [Obelidium mucronatum]
MSTGASTDDCSHEVQFKGMCAMCLKDLSIPTFNGSEMSKATISMTHDALGVFVSAKVAEKLERETAQRLRSERKLSLILDLDQTVIHAAVDATVGEWMKDPTNPSYPALSAHLNSSNTASKLYELHIYTMGTRNYAEAVAKIIDPTGKLFNQRILSRDESGSFQEKRIGRLFPGEGEKMAVIVDDRGDVWQWCKNLIRIKPYDFFLGIGDINEPIGAAAKAAKVFKQTGKLPEIPSITPPAVVAPASGPSATAETPELSRLEELNQDVVTLATTEIQAQDEPPSVAAKHIHDALETIQQHSLHRQEVERLLQKERPVLSDKDTELNTVWALLEQIHKDYYARVDVLQNGQEHNEPQEDDADVRKVMDVIRRQVLKGCEVVLSGVVPIGFDIRRNDLYRFATIFGGRVTTDIMPTTTHLVAAKLGTDKANKALKMGIHVVHPDWLYYSAFAWKRLPEEHFTLKKDHQPQSHSNASSGRQTPAGGNTSSSSSVADSSSDLLEDDGVEVDIGAIDWGDADAEIDDALDDSDDEEGGGYSGSASGSGGGPGSELRSGTEDGNEEDDDWDLEKEIEGALGDVVDDASSSGGGSNNRKRSRSPSPSASAFSKKEKWE